MLHCGLARKSGLNTFQKQTEMRKKTRLLKVQHKYRIERGSARISASLKKTRSLNQVPSKCESARHRGRLKS